MNTERDYKIARAKLDVREAEVELQAAKDRMDLGVEKAKAVYHETVADLTEKWKKAQVNLEREKVYVEEFTNVVGGSL